LRKVTEKDAAAKVVSAMSELLDAVARGQGYSNLDPSILDGVTIPVGHGLGGAEQAGKSAADLLNLASGIVSSAAAGTDNWKSGSVCCMQCGGSDCVHATPPSPTDVFAGYLATGKPNWVDFAHLCIDRHVEGFETLFVQRPGVVGVSIPGSDIESELLDSFRDAAYRVVWAVNVGLVPADFEPVRSGQDRISLSLLAVLLVRGGRPAVRLNAVGLDTDALDHAAGNQGSRGPAERVRRILAATAGRLEAISSGLRHEARVTGPEDVNRLVDRLAGGVGPVMNRLRSDLVAVFQGVDDRTRHGEQRARSGSRPTSAAFGDAESAPDESLLMDMVERTVIVAGPRGRCHVFTTDGRLVTSITLNDGDFQARIVHGRWRPLKESDISQFRQAISRRR